jgi:hypothetical protein
MLPLAMLSLEARERIARKVGPAIDATATEISPHGPPPVKDLAPVGISSAQLMSLVGARPDILSTWAHFAF